MFARTTQPAVAFGTGGNCVPCGAIHGEDWSEMGEEGNKGE